MSKALEIIRGPLVESVHRAHIAVVDSNNRLLYYYGDYDKIIYARSAIKPIQAIQVLETKATETYNITDKEIAFMCSSHNGEEYHIQCVKDILEKSGLKVEDLKSGTSAPLSFKEYKKLIESKIELNNMHNCCSGKHCGMLISAKNLKEPLNTYLDLDHPIQQRILENIAFVCDYNKNKIIIGIDGCGAPVHALPIRNLAYGFARLADSKTLGYKKLYVDRIISSMIKYPEMVAGKERFCTDIMTVCRGRIFGKIGAQGVYLLGDKESKLGICVKIEDGNFEVTPYVVMEVLRQLKLISKEEIEELQEYLNPKLLNSKKEVIGEVRANFKMNDNKSI